MSTTTKKTLLKKIMAGSLIFYIFSGVSSVLNYAFYPVLARFVSTSQYGEIQFLVSMFTQLAVGFVVLNILAIVISVELTPERQKQAIRDLTTVASIIILTVVAIGSIILYVNQSSLGIHNQSSIVALGISLVINVPFTVAIGRLQGNNHFIASGILSTLGAFFKLAFSLLFVIIGWGVPGAILGIGIGMLVTLAITEGVTYGTKTTNFSKPLSRVKSSFQNLNFIRERSAVAIITVTVITLLSTADSVVSRLYLDSHAAGQYAAVATLAKAILAATSPLMWLALPAAVARDKRKILLYTFVAVGLSAIAYSLFTVFPGFFLQFLLSIDTGRFTPLLSLSSLAMSLCSIAFIMTTVGICLGALRTTIISATIATFVYFIVYFVLKTMLDPVVASLWGQSASGLCYIVGGIFAIKQKGTQDS